MTALELSQQLWLGGVAGGEEDGAAVDRARCRCEGVTGRGKRSATARCRYLFCRVAQIKKLTKLPHQGERERQ